jgi:hypothetical protein
MNGQTEQPNAQLPEGGHFLTKKEMAARLSINLRTLERWQHDGFLPYIQIETVVLFYWPDVVAHLMANFRVGSKGRPIPANEPTTQTSADPN